MELRGKEQTNMKITNKTAFVRLCAAQIVTYAKLSFVLRGKSF